MKNGQASRTALGAAGHRAAHQAIEGGLVFADPLALRILGGDAEEVIASAKGEPERRALRLFVAMRSRFAEDAARQAIEAGVRQILVLGAGLDTFAYRLEPHDGLKFSNSITRRPSATSAPASPTPASASPPGLRRATISSTAT